MFWRKKRKEQDNEQIQSKPKIVLDKNERLKILLDDEVYLDAYQFSETSQGKELFPDFFVLADLLEKEFSQTVSNKENIIENIDRIENLGLSNYQKFYFIGYLIRLLVNYAKLRLDRVLYKNVIAILALIDRYHQQIYEELAEITVKLEFENEQLKEENKFQRRMQMREQHKVNKMLARVEVLKEESKLLEEKILEQKVEQNNSQLPTKSPEPTDKVFTSVLNEQTSGESNQKKNTNKYPPHYLKQIIDTAVRLFEEKDKVYATDIYTEIGIEKNTYHRRIRSFKYDTSKVLDEARTIIRERKKSK